MWFWVWVGLHSALHRRAVAGIGAVANISDFAISNPTHIWTFFMVQVTLLIFGVTKIFF